MLGRAGHHDLAIDGSFDALAERLRADQDDRADQADRDDLEPPLGGLPDWQISHGLAAAWATVPTLAQC